LLAVGGINAVVPEIHRQTVEMAQVMTDRQFTDLFAIAQAAPGPNVIFATLIGYQIAGWVGAAVTTLAMCGPTCVLTYFVGQLADRFKEARWRIATQAGLVPVSVGLVAATALLLARAADHNWVDVALTVTTAAVALKTRINPLWMLGLAALVGLAGWA
jgi:chromate transporter